MKVTEHCNCGAQFTVDTETPADAMDAITTWREAHRHPTAVPSKPTDASEAPGSVTTTAQTAAWTETRLGFQRPWVGR